MVVTRLRIYLGSLAALLGTPLFISCIVDPSLPALSFLWSGALVAAGIALLFPARWTE